MMSNLSTVSKRFGEVVVVNTTPHPITFDFQGNLEIIQSDKDWLINARVEEQPVGDSGLFVKSNFVPAPDGWGKIKSIEDWFATNPDYEGCTLVIIGSIIAAQAYPGRVFGMTPAPGYERVAPSEKRMRVDKFTTF